MCIGNKITCYTEWTVAYMYPCNATVNEHGAMNIGKCTQKIRSTVVNVVVHLTVSFVLIHRLSLFILEIPSFGLPLFLLKRLALVRNVCPDS